MNLLSWDEIFRLIPIAALAGLNLYVVYYLFTKCYKEQAKFLEDEINKWNSMK